LGEQPTGAQSPYLGMLPSEQDASIGTPPQLMHGIPGSHMPPGDTSFAYIDFTSFQIVEVVIRLYLHEPTTT